MDADAALASRLGTIVVEFEYRSGLLGFLPFSDTGQSLGSAATGASGARQNHAIWDQIGALHWLKRNIGHFNGNANNLTVVASDNEANKFVQLLVQSPIAKGLFNRAVLVHDAGRSGDQALPFTQQPAALQDSRPIVSMRHLLDLALEARELRKRLVGALTNIAESKLLSSSTNRSSSSQVNDRNVFELIQSCDLSQLAVIENELRRLQLTSTAAAVTANNSTNDNNNNSDQRLQGLLFALATEPNLDDPILFPHLSERLKRAKALQQRAASGGLMAKLAMNRQRGSATSNSAMANQIPTTASYSDIVYDSILFPSFVSPSYNNLNAATRLRAEVAYCFYMRQIGKNLLSDTLSLLPRQQRRPPPPSSSSSSSSSSSLYDSPNDNNKLMSENRTTMYDPAAAAHRVEWHRDSPNSMADAAAAQHRRRLAAAEFDHLRQVHLVRQSLNHKLDSSGVAQEVRAAVVNADDNNNEDDDDLSQVAHRQQYRTMLMNIAGHGSSSSAAARRARRQYHPFDATGGGSEYNAIPLGSIDLLLGFIGDSPKRPLAEPSPSNKIVQPMAAIEHGNITNLFEEMAHELDDTLLMWHKLADVSFLSNFVDNRTLLAQLCDFGTSIHLGSELKHKTYLFVKFTKRKPIAVTKANSIAIDSDLNRDNTNDSTTNEQHQDWISEEILPAATGQSDSQDFQSSSAGDSEYSDKTPTLIDSLRQFIYLGEPEPKQWRPYDSLNRPLRQFTDNRQVDTDFVHHRSSLSLDTLPYLRSTMSELLRNQTSASGSKSVQTTATGAQQTTRQSHSDPINEWFTCLNDLNVAIGRWRESLTNGNDSLAPIRLREEAQCLTNSEIRLRLKVRRSALDDLEILLLSNGSIWSLEVSSGSDSSTNGRGTNAELLRVLHEASADGGSGAKLHRTSVTTRNSGESDPGSYEYANHLIDNSGGLNSTNGAAGSGLKGFLAKAYKDSIGKALAMVVGTGLLIFLLNLIIVLVISIRSRQSRRRCAAVRDISCGSGAGTGTGTSNGNNGGSGGTAAYGGNYIGDANTDDKFDRACEFAAPFANLIETPTNNGFDQVEAQQNNVVHLDHPNQHQHRQQPIVSYPMQQFNQQVSALGVTQVPNQSVSYSSTSSSSSFRGCAGAGTGGGYNTCSHSHHEHNHVHSHNHNHLDSSQVTTTTSPGDESCGGTIRRSVNKQLKFDLLNAPKRYDSYSKNSILSNNNKINAYSDNNNDNDNMFMLSDSGFLDPNDLTIKIGQVSHSTFQQMNDCGANRHRDCSTNSAAATVATTPIGCPNQQHHCQIEHDHNKMNDNNSAGTMNSPLYGSQSTATTTTTTTTNNNNNNGDNINYNDLNSRTGSMRYSVYDQRIPASGSSYQIQYSGHNSNNIINDTSNLLLTATSPSSSTTLSLTPMQLEHLVAAGSGQHNSATVNMEHATLIDGTDVICDYQIEPIGLLCAVSQQQQQQQQQRHVPIKSNGSAGDEKNHRHHFHE